MKREFPLPDPDLRQPADRALVAVQCHGDLRLEDLA